MSTTIVDRFMSKVDQSGDCWLWTAATNGVYGVFTWNRRQGYAHRYSYEHHVGVIPTGMVIDHLCKVQLCVNPVHLEAVTQQVNVDRSDGAKAASLARRPDPTMCGAELHDWVDANIYRDPRGRARCRACKRENDNANNLARRIALSVVTP